MEDNLATLDFTYGEGASDNSPALPVPPPIHGNVLAKVPLAVEQDIEELDTATRGFIQNIITSFKTRPIMTAITFALVSFALILSLTLLILITQHIT